MSSPGWGFLEFFAGGGMARLGLGARWQCLFANEICPKKAAAYRANFGPSPELRVEDIWRLTPADLPSSAALAWGSFPCQDLSLAGNGAGLNGHRSGTFTAFWRLVEAARPPVAALENVTGALTANGGRDFRAIIQAIAASGYRAGALIVDAAHFLPQSRPRLFIIAVRKDAPIPKAILQGAPSAPWHSPRLVRAVEEFPAPLRRAWLWWRVPEPPARTTVFADLIEPDLPCHTKAETRRLLSLMNSAHRAKVQAAQRAGGMQVGSLYRRIRQTPEGRALRAEVRFDGLSGCLRTPTGGSSRQTVVLVDGRDIRTRLLSAREAARLMGLPDRYRLPEKYNEAYHVAGDGLAVPAVAWIERHLLRRICEGL